METGLYEKNENRKLNGLFFVQLSFAKANISPWKQSLVAAFGCEPDLRQFENSTDQAERILPSITNKLKRLYHNVWRWTNNFPCKDVRLILWLLFFFFSLIHAFSPVDLICFPNTDHVTIPRRFEPLSCSLINRAACEHDNVRLWKKIFPWVSSHDLFGKTNRGHVRWRRVQSSFRVGHQLPGELNWKILFLWKLVLCDHPHIIAE